jgi:hypothetical protein
MGRQVKAHHSRAEHGHLLSKAALDGILRGAAKAMNAQNDPADSAAHRQIQFARDLQAVFYDLIFGFHRFSPPNRKWMDIS